MAEVVLHPLHLKKLAEEWILEDSPNFDFAGAAVGNTVSTFEIIVKTPGTILAGIPFANAIFEVLDLQPKWFYHDSSALDSRTVIGKVSGTAKNLLLSERVVLNVLCRASGVATAAVEFLKKLRSNGWMKKLAGTRKTTPGFRLVEKYALLVAGVDPHRYDLSSMVMLKDNHIFLNGSIFQAVKNVREFCGFAQKIEVECCSLKDAMIAAKAGCDVVMFDNLEPTELLSAAQELKAKFPNVLIEASGGITIENVLEYAMPDIDIISSSSLVQGYRAVDISMKVENYTAQRNN